MKRALALDECVESVEEYCAGKNGVMRKILKQAGWTDEDLDVVTKSNLYARGMLSSSCVAGGECIYVLDRRMVLSYSNLKGGNSSQGI